MQLELSNINAVLSSVNPRSEIHGEEKVPAGDLKLKVQLGNDCLAMFHPQLKSMLYHYDKNEAEHDDLVEKAAQKDANYAPHQRFPQIPSISWKDEMIGAKVIVHTGIDKKSDIVLDPCNVNSISLEPQNGGTVIVNFRVQTHPDEKAFGKLCGMVGTTIKVSVEPPKPEEELS